MKKLRILNSGQNYRVVGGSDKYLIELGKLLESNGHEVVPFAGDHPDNLKSIYSKFFPKTLDIKNPSITNIHSFFYSKNSKHAIARLLDNVKINLAHLHIIYGVLTESILSELKNRNIPIVQSLHDYRLICPTYSMIHKNNYCNSCNGKHFYKAIVKKCNNNSIIRSSASAISSYVSQFVGFQTEIDTFIALSHFQKDQLILSGIDSNKIRTIHNFVDTDEFKPSYGNEDYLLYFGRIEKLKGVDMLIEAAIKTNIKLKIIGDGGYVNEMLKLIDKRKNISYLGFKQGAELEKIISSSKATILPSLHNEICPLSVLESFAYGKPVIASNRGGIPELVTHGYNGLVFDPNKPSELESCLKEFSKIDLTQLSRNARKTVEERFNKKEHYNQMMDLYSTLIR